MPPEKVLFINLNEDDTNLLGKTISSPICKKIIDLLTEKNYTETDIANELQIPLSTAHYNIQLLKKAGIIKTDDYHYSKKGKEILHYSLASKYIIISPRTTFGIREKLRAALPVFLMILFASLILAFQSTLFEPMGMPQANIAPALMQKAVPVAYDAGVVEESQPMLASTTAKTENIEQQPKTSNLNWLYLLLGGIIAIGGVIVAEWLKANRAPPL